jgi:hypothetical protein
MATPALILIEGDTEYEFIQAIAEKFFRSYPKKIRNLHGNFSINKKIIDKALAFSETNPGQSFLLCVCIDQERINVPAFDRSLVENELKAKGVECEIVPVIATLMMESLFFIDIDGIYAFLRAQHSRRNPNKYRNFRLLTHKDLSRLFQQFNKLYVKGRRTENFVNNLDLSKIAKTAGEISGLIFRLNGRL